MLILQISTHRGSWFLPGTVGNTSGWGGGEQWRIPWSFRVWRSDWGQAFLLLDIERFVPIKYCGLN